MEQEGKYIYCIIQGAGPMDFGTVGIGECGSRVYTIYFQDLSAVVSDSPVKRYSVSRENLISHERAIEEVMKTYTVLPVRFATIAEVEDKVKKILEKEYSRFVDLLKTMEGKKELGLKAVFKEDIVYKEILANNDGIRIKKEKMAKDVKTARYQELIELGRLVETALIEEKTRYKDDILNVLEPLALGVKVNNTYGEHIIINAAFLIERQKESEFDRKVGVLADSYTDKIKFKYVGTLPPFNFVNIEINTRDY